MCGLVLCSLARQGRRKKKIRTKLPVLEPNIRLASSSLYPALPAGKLLLADSRRMHVPALSLLEMFEHPLPIPPSHILETRFCNWVLSAP